MKTRNGFVSNSSSSSFIVAVNKKLKGVISLTIEVDLNKYAESIISNIDDLNKYFAKYNKSEDDIADEVAFRRAIKEGKDVFIGSFSSEAESLECFLCNNGIDNVVNPKNKDVEVIQGEGGY